MVGGFRGMFLLTAKHSRSLVWCETPYERRFGMPLNGPVIPFGAMVEYHPVPAKDQSRLHQFGANVLPGIFLGYALNAGEIWKGDILIADIEEVDQMDASEIDARRLKAKEVLTLMKGDIFYIPSRRWNSQNPWRRSTSETIHFHQGSSRTGNSSRRIRRTLLSIPTSRWLNTRWCGS